MRPKRATWTLLQLGKLRKVTPRDFRNANFATRGGRLCSLSGLLFCLSSMSDTFVKSFTHLKGRPQEERALPMLQRIASLVKPIMRKHNFVLPVLSEFFPAQDNLIGLYCSNIYGLTR